MDSIRFGMGQRELELSQRIACEPHTRATSESAVGKAFLALIVVAAGVFMLSSIGALKSPLSKAIPDIYWSIGAVITLFLLAITYIWHCGQVRMDAQIKLFGPFPVDVLVNVSDDGFRVESRHGTGFYPWSLIKEVRELPGHVVVIAPLGPAAVIPFGAFGADSERVSFVASIRSRTST